MPLVYSFSVKSESTDETDICVCFAKKAPLKLRTGSGDFRVFIRRLELQDDGYAFAGKVGMTDVQGVYNQVRKEGIVIFFQESRVHSFDLRGS